LLLSAMEYRNRTSYLSPPCSIEMIHFITKWAEKPRDDQRDE